MAATDKIYSNDTILAQYAPSDTSVHTAYTVPAGTQVYVSGVRVFNTHASVAAKATVGYAPAGAGDATVQHMTGGSVTAGETVLLPIGAWMNPTDVINVIAGAATLVFTVMGR